MKNPIKKLKYYLVRRHRWLVSFNEPDGFMNVWVDTDMKSLSKRDLDKASKLLSDHHGVPLEDIVCLSVSYLGLMSDYQFGEPLQ